MKAFFNKLITVRSIRPDDEFLFWRERIVTVALAGAAILVTGLFGIQLYSAIQSQEWAWVIIYVIAYAVIFLIAFSSQIPYIVRTGLLLAFFYAFGLISAYRSGAAGGASVWLIGFAILAGIFLGPRMGVGATILSTISLVLMGIGLDRGWIIPRFPLGPVDPQNLSSWLSLAFLLLAIGTIIVISYGIILNGLEASLKTRRQIADEFERDRERIERRSHELHRRKTQVIMAADISRTISAQLDLEILFPQVVNLVKERFNLYYVGVFTLDITGLIAMLQAGTGEEGRLMLEAGHHLPVRGTSMIGWAISRRQARIAQDTGIDAVRFDNPFLPDTRSELALPLISGTQVLGAITVQSDQPDAFDLEDIIVYQGIADGLATSIENVRLFQQSEENLLEIRRLHRHYLNEAWADVIHRGDKLSYTFENPQQGSPNNASPTSVVKPIIVRDHIIGNITLETDKPSWDPDEEAFISAIISQASVALENVRLMEDTQRSARHSRIVADLANKVWASADIDAILRTTLSELVQSLQATNGFIQLDQPELSQDTPDSSL